MTSQAANSSWWSRLGGPNAVSIPAWLLPTPVAVAAFQPDAVAIAGGPGSVPVFLALLAVPVAGQVVLGSVYGLAWLTYLRPSDRGSRPIATVLTYLLAGGIRAFYVEASARILFDYSLPDGVMRSLIAIVVSAVLTIIATVCVDAVREHRKTRRELELQLWQVKEFEAQAERALMDYRESLVDDVRQKVVREVEAVLASARQDPENLSNRLAEVTRKVIGPLVAALQRDNASVQVSLGHPEVTVKRADNALRESIIRRPFVPVASAVLIIVLGGTASAYVYGPFRAYLGVGLQAAVTWLGLSFAQRWVAPRLTRLSLGSATMLVVGLWILVVLVSLVVAVATLRVLPGALELSPPTSVLLTRGFAFIIVCVAAPAIAVGSSERWKESEADLRAAIDNVARRNAALQLAAWSQRRWLGTRLHGQVQADLVAVALRLASDRDADVDAVLRELSNRVSQALKSDTGLDWRMRLEEIETVWRHSITLTVRMGEEMKGCLDAHPVSALAACEIVREGITNAVRAGRADSVRVDLEDFGEVIRVAVADDGCGLQGAGPAGEGTRLLDEVSLEWTRYSENGVTHLEALIAKVLPPTSALLGSADVDQPVAL